MTFLGLPYGYTVGCPAGGLPCGLHVADEPFTASSIVVEEDVVAIAANTAQRLRQAIDYTKAPSESVWSVNLGFEPVHGGLHHDGYVVFSSTQGQVVVLDADSGDEVWSLDMGTRMEAQVTIHPDEDLVFAAGNDGVVRALTIRGGAERWSYTAQDAVLGGVHAGDVEVVVASADGVVTVLDLSDGTPLWSYDTGATLEARPLLFDGTVVVMDDNGHVFAIEGP